MTKTMVTSALLLTLLLFTAVVSAGVPGLISYQGRLTNSTGEPVADATYQVVFAVYSDSSASFTTPLWTELHNVSTTDGLFNVLLGTTNPFPQSAFDGTVLYLGMTIGVDPELQPRAPIVSVPYALAAGSIVGDMDCSACDWSFINSAGPDELVATADTALKVINTGTGAHVGLASRLESGSTNPVTSIRGVAVSTNSTSTSAASFEATSTGSGPVYGVLANTAANTDSAAYGSYARAQNNGTGTTYGGVFEADSTGSGSILVGCKGNGLGSNSEVVGIQGSAQNNSATYYALGALGLGINLSGPGYGGWFYGRGDNNTGIGVAGRSYDYIDPQDEAIGVLGVASGRAVSASYGGYFGTSASGGTQYGVYSQAINAHDQTQYGLYALALSTTGGLSSFGAYGRSEHHGSGNSYGGYFLCDSSGTGISYGGRTVGISKGSASAYGLASYAANPGTGAVYGGYFEAANLGTGTKYAVYAKSPLTGYAGFFDGSVLITHALTVIGAKSAAVRTDNDDYRLVYCQESTENWFEDFGEGRLVGGRAHIELDQLYLQTVTIDDQNQMKVFIQPNDPDCNGTAVIRGTTGFDVIELQNGSGNASFSYRVVAKRRGFERERLERLPGPTPEQVILQTESDSAVLRASEKLTEEEVARQKERDSKKESEIGSIVPLGTIR